MNECDLLIIDDQPGVLKLLQEVFRGDGFRVLTAKRGKQALELLKEESPDVVLLDLKMPDMDGNEILQEIRKEDAALPVIIMSAYDRKEDLAEEKDGMQYYISKPFDLDEIRSIVQEATGSGGNYYNRAF